MPALFTVCRVDPIILPNETYCYDIMGGCSFSFLNVVSLALVYFTGAIVTLQPLLRGWQTFVEIRNYGIYGKTDFDEWWNGGRDKTNFHRMLRIVTTNHRITLSFNTSVYDELYR